MKKRFASLVVLSLLPMSAFAVDNGESTTPVFDDRVPLEEKLLRQYKTENPNVVYRKKEEPVVVIKEYKMEAPKNVRVSKWYMGLRGDLSFLSWKNEYTGNDTNGDIVQGSDKFNFKPLLGLDLSVGYRFDKNVRGDIEIGYIGKYSETETEYYDSPEKTEFNLETYYATVNAYRDIAYGIYAGFGAGLAVVDISADHTIGNGSATNVSPIGALMLGWTYTLDEKIDFDVRYRFSVFGGGDMMITQVKTDLGVLINNTVSAGISYHF